MAQKEKIPGRNLLNDFKQFIMKGNVLDMAVGIIIGAAFGTIVKSLVDDIIMPPIGLLLGNLDFSNLFWVIKEPANQIAALTTPEIAKNAGAVTMNYGRFINNIVTFLIVAFAVFMMIKVVTNLQKGGEEEPVKEPTEKECPYCISKIPINAKKCPHCTADL